MNKISKFYENHKGKVMIAVSLLVMAGVGYGVYNIATNKYVDRIEGELPTDKESVLADYIISGNDLGLIRLIGVKDGKELKSIDLNLGKNSKYGYSRSNDLTKLYAYGQGENTFYEISEENKELVSNVFLDLKDNRSEFLEFKIQGDNVVTLTLEKNGFNKISKTNGKSELIPTDDIVEQWVLLENQIIYTAGNKVCSINLKDNSVNKVDIGDFNTGLFYAGGEIIAFNKFGSGKDTSIMLKINPSDLYIKDVFKFESSNVVGLTSDDDDTSIYYTEELKDKENISQLLSNVDLMKLTKNNVSINPKKNVAEFKYNSENTIGSKGYIYSLIDNNLEIIDTRSKEMAYKIELGNSVFVPILR